MAEKRNSQHTISFVCQKLLQRWTWPTQIRDSKKNSRNPVKSNHGSFGIFPFSFLVLGKYGTNSKRYGCEASLQVSLVGPDSTLQSNSRQDKEGRTVISHCILSFCKHEHLREQEDHGQAVRRVCHACSMQILASCFFSKWAKQLSGNQRMDEKFDLSLRLACGKTLSKWEQPIHRFAAHLLFDFCTPTTTQVLPPAGGGDQPAVSTTHHKALLLHWSI